MYETLLNIIVYLDCEQCPIALYTRSCRTIHQYNHDQVLIKSKLCINVIKVMCGINDNLESNNRQINLASPMIEIWVPYRYSSGSKCSFHSWQKWTHMVLVGENLKPFSSYLTLNKHYYYYYKTRKYKYVLFGKSWKSFIFRLTSVLCGPYIQKLIHFNTIQIKPVSRVYFIKALHYQMCQLLLQPLFINIIKLHR